jgi:CRISPR-associated exonuclease Cas4
MISALEHWSYCPRQCALIHLEQTFDENLYTLRGRMLHERVDQPEGEMQSGVRIERAVPLWSERLGLIGKADVVEFHRVEIGTSQKGTGPIGAQHPKGRPGKLDPSPFCTPYPVEYKHGKKRRWGHDDLQVCAQAMCLEEMTGQDVPRGAIFYHGSRRRKEVAFDEKLRSLVEESVAAVRAMFDDARLPPAVNDRRCTHCSLKESCMPDVVDATERLSDVEGELFSVEITNSS